MCVTHSVACYFRDPMADAEQAVTEHVLMSDCRIVLIGSIIVTKYSSRW